MEIINRVISQSVNGGHCFSYQVHCTSERVLLFYGIVPKSHIVELEQLIFRQTNSTWVSCPRVATLAKAKYAVGHPELIEAFEKRLSDALANAKIKE